METDKSVRTYYDVKRGLRMRQAIAPKLSEFVGKTLDGRTFTEFVTLLKKHMPTSVDRDWIIESLHPYPTKRVKMTRDLLESEAWRILGNSHWQRTYQSPLPRWKGQRDEEWMPLQFVKERPIRVYSKALDLYRPGHEYQARVLGGSLCATLLTLQWTTSQCVRVACEVGFARLREGELRNFSNGALLVQLRVWALAKPIDEKSYRSEWDAPHFTEYAVNSGFKSYNTQIIRARTRDARWTDFRCPYDYDHSCAECPVGYADPERRCVVGIRPLTCERGTCSRCGNDDMVFEASDEICIVCRDREAMQIKRTRR